jgi:hypothetical protein
LILYKPDFDRFEAKQSPQLRSSNVAEGRIVAVGYDEVEAQCANNGHFEKAWRTRNSDPLQTIVVID